MGPNTDPLRHSFIDFLLGGLISVHTSILLSVLEIACKPVVNFASKAIMQ